MTSTIMIVWRKELTEAIRDRRSLLSGLMYAIWGPLVMAIAVAALARDRDPHAALTVAVRGGDRAASLVAFLEERSVRVVSEAADPSGVVRERAFAVALSVDGDYPDHFEAARPATVRLLYDGTWTESAAKARRLRTLLAEYDRRVGEARLVLRGVEPSVAAPLVVDEQDLSSAAARAAAPLAMLPIFLLLSVFVGGMSLASDITAGERERGSLESLLVHPAPRLALVTGKWAAASVLCVATLLLTLLVSQAVLRHPRLQAIDLPLGLSGLDSVAAFAALLPLALMVPAVQLSLSLVSRTFKEAQTQLSLLMLAPMIPGFLFAFGTIRESAWMAWTPVLGQHLLVSGILSGQPSDPGAALGLALSTLACGALALALTTMALGREGIVRGPQG